MGEGGGGKGGREERGSGRATSGAACPCDAYILRKGPFYSCFFVCTLACAIPERANSHLPGGGGGGEEVTRVGRWR
jgi:hypothetical protein